MLLVAKYLLASVVIARVSYRKSRCFIVVYFPTFFYTVAILAVPNLKCTLELVFFQYYRH